MSAAPKFTPGPWNVVNTPPTNALDIAVIFDVDSQVVCSIPKGSSHKPMQERRANAAFIAAAPELYEALEAIERAIHDRNYFAIESAFDAGGFARAALAKARGES